MRHRVDHRKLGRTAAHRRAMLSNMVTSLFLSERITTTDAKAKEARRLAERLITRAKKGYQAKQDGRAAEALAHWRQAARYVRDTAVLRKLFEQIAPHFIDRNGGYTRIIHMGNRLGDNAREVMLELVDTDVTTKPHEKGRRAEGEEAEASDAKKARGKSKAKSKAGSKAKSKSKAKSGGKSKAKSKTKAKGKSKSKAKSKSGGKTKSKAKS